MSLFDTLRFIAAHPLNRAHPGRALARFVRWQLATRWHGGVREMPFVDAAVLRVARGMTGATGNVYCGLHEFADMAFLLHFLRADELFVDIGANVGSWTVLAAAVCGARVVSIEPAAPALAALHDNLLANRIQSRVAVHSVALAGGAGQRRFAHCEDTTNRLVDQDFNGPTVQVSTTTLDALLGGAEPVLLKIDVEGAESEVLDGAGATLGRGAAQAMIVEFSGAGAAALLERLGARGYTACRYWPQSRQIDVLDAPQAIGNVLLLRDVDDARRRVATAKPRSIHATGSIL